MGTLLQLGGWRSMLHTILFVLGFMLLAEQLSLSLYPVIVFYDLFT